MPSKEELKMLQALPLEIKVAKTKQRIREFVERFGEDGVYVSFSGGKDSTVLKHIVDQMGYDIPSVFVNTGLEFMEIQTFVHEVKAGKYDCFNKNVEILRPEMRFDEVIRKYGFPVVSKEVSQVIEGARSLIANGRKDGYRLKQLNGELLDKHGNKSRFNCAKWKFLLEADFKISHRCCNVMKKKPAKKYERETGRKCIVGTMATESLTRKHAWIKTGCNAFVVKRPISKPLSFWTEQDIFHYIKRFNVPYCPVYGEIQVKHDHETELSGQLNLIDYLGCYDEEETLETTGCKRTGCMFCAFGCHLEKEPSRFQRLKETHPRQYEYCIGGGEYDADGIWKPNKEGLGMGHVFDELNKIYGEGFIKYK